MNRFGNLPALLAANKSRVRRASCVEAASIVTLLGETLRWVLRSEALRGPVLDRSQALHAYLRYAFAHARHEHVRCLFLDTSLRLICEDEICEGGIDSATAPVRTILTRALDVGASGLILVHNHPSGQRVPSAGDLAFTRRLVAGSRELDVTVYDHVVVASEGTTSFRDQGLL